MEQSFHYRNKSFRMSEEVYEELYRLKGDLSWNRFFNKLLEAYVQKEEGC